ncbi:MAG TPA: enoyl-CoA hydratase-related protein [Dehalococcoidia bacterium]|nr:enoyl-CoA hydratase-related protein [Dehalococcoidia bacterium]
MVTQTEYKYILFEQRDRVGIITLNRPDRLNAWTYAMGGEVKDAIEACNQDPGIGAIIVTGAGRGFCAGADIQGFNQSIENRESASSEKSPLDPPEREREHLAAFLRRSKPLIAAINGPSIGVGLTMTLPMDIRIASEAARFSMRFIRIGITPEVASTTYLAQIVGLPNALDLILTARIIDAEEAVQMGLVNDVVAPDKLMDEAMAVASMIAANPLDCVMEGKRMIHQHMVAQDVDAVVAEENRTFARAQKGPAHKEAVRAFIEKREPQFNQS